MIKIDLHTHSEASRDGGITPEQYAAVLERELLDVIAITDHDRIDFALGMQAALGRERIIVGEEITTTGGEIIGLYLTEKIEPGLSPQATIDAIKTQGGLVCIPHPFEKVRKGLSLELLEALRPEVDIIEGFNGRAFVQNFGPQAAAWAVRNNKVSVANSDAHALGGLGKTYTIIQHKPSRTTLLGELAHAQLVMGRPPLHTLLFPKYNRLRKTLRGQNG